MALSPASALHYWSARYGTIPIVGGPPVHTRNGAGAWIDQQGIVQSAIVNTPRFNWETIAGERRPVMTLEEARTNLVFPSDDYSNAAWTKGNVTVTPAAAIAPDGTLTAQKLQATASAATELYQAATVAATVVSKTVFIRKGSGATEANRYGLRNVTTATNLLFVSVNFDTGVITYLIGAVGASIKRCGGDWWALTLSVSAGISSGNSIRTYTAFTADNEAAGEYSYAWRDQLEPNPTRSSPIKTVASSATRPTDAFYWGYSPPPQAMAFYVRFIERGSIFIGSSWHLALSTTNERFILIRASGYAAYHETGSGFRLSEPAVSPDPGDTVEVLGLLNGDGSVVGIQSVNGGAVAAGGASAALALTGAWGEQRLYLSVSPALADHGEVKIVKLADLVGVTAQARMDEMRSFELNAAGEMIS